MDLTNVTDIRERTKGYNYIRKIKKLAALSMLYFKNDFRNKKN
jgi:hypothetical protein